MSKLGVSFFLETHSESLLLRFRRRLAETSGGNPEDDSLRLSQEAFRAYFVERGDGTSTVEALLFDEWGDYKRRPAGFGDFFGTDFRELSKMKKARLSV